MPNDIELGWLIGIVEGEGSISLEKDGTRYNPEIHVTNTNLLIIERLERMAAIPCRIFTLCRRALRSYRDAMRLGYLENQTGRNACHNE